MFSFSTVQIYEASFLLFEQKIPKSVSIFVKKRFAMAIIITDECINCGACEPECPNNAIYEGGAEWKYSDGTTLKGMITTLNGDDLEADKAQDPVDMDV